MFLADKNFGYGESCHLKLDNYEGQMTHSHNYIQCVATIDLVKMAPQGYGIVSITSNFLLLTCN